MPQPAWSACGNTGFAQKHFHLIVGGILGPAKHAVKQQWRSTTDRLSVFYDLGRTKAEIRLWMPPPSMNAQDGIH